MPKKRKPLALLHSASEDALPPRGGDEKRGGLARYLSFSVQGGELPPRVDELLETFGLNLDDLRQLGISARTFQKIIDKGCSGHVMRWLALDSLLTKAILFPFLDERGIQEAEVKGSGCADYLSTRVWPRERTVPFRAASLLKRSQGVHAFTDGVEEVITRL